MRHRSGEWGRKIPLERGLGNKHRIPNGYCGRRSRITEKPPSGGFSTLEDLRAMLRQGREAAPTDWCGPQRSEDTGQAERILDALR